jgi:phosphate:Na+ symporter
MQQSLLVAGMLAGGLGMFLLAVSMITDGLKVAAGDALRGLLANWTRTPLHGIFTGLSITALVQSSSAVTVATIGFVNAGLIGMRRALGIVYGSNIGTTMTGWLVAVVGFKINVEAFALPLIGLGMLLQLSGGASKRAPLGLALAGFGLFFIGIDVLREAFEGLMLAVDLSSFTADGISGVLLFTGIGFLMTVLTQSSSAAIAITLTAASGGVLGLYAAAAMVIGANVGTTSTAAIAVIGATANARRVASAHIIFNLGTGLVALLILPILFWLLSHIETILGLQAVPTVTLALFHTVFNLLGVVLIFPLNNRLADFLEKRFVTRDEVEGRPRYLDKTVAVSVDIAIDALLLEMARVTDLTRAMALASLSSEASSGKRIEIDNQTVIQLSAAIAEFIAEQGRGVLDQEASQQLGRILRADQYLLIVAEQALEISRQQAGMTGLEDSELKQIIARFQAEAATLLQSTDMSSASFSHAECEAQLQQLQVHYEDVKATLMQAGSELRVPIPSIIEVVDQNSRIKRLCRELVGALRLLSQLAHGDTAVVQAPATAVVTGAAGD